MKCRYLLGSVLIWSMLLITGCISDEANRCYTKFPARPINEVEVLEAEPQRPHIIIADFQAVHASVKHMRKRAAQIGADAVIVVPVGGWYSNDEVWANEDRHANSYSRLIATAIKYEVQ